MESEKSEAGWKHKNLHFHILLPSKQNCCNKKICKDLKRGKYISRLKDENIPQALIFIFCFPANKIVAKRKYAKIWKEESIFLDWTYRKLWLCLSELGLICVVGFHRCVQLMQHFEHLSIVMMMMMMTEKMMMKNSFNVSSTNERIKQRSVWYKSVNFSQSINW